MTTNKERAEELLKVICKSEAHNTAWMLQEVLQHLRKQLSGQNPVDFKDELNVMYVLVYQVDDDGDLRGTVVNFKQFYLYKNEARLDDGIQFTYEELKTLPWTEISSPRYI